MKIEQSGLWLDHPDRNPSQRAVRMNHDGDRLAAMSCALSESDYRPVMRVEAVVDRNFRLLL